LVIQSTNFIFIGDEKKEISIKNKAGLWMNEHLPKDAIVFGQDPRYSGLLSLGGNEYLDYLYLDTAALNAAAANLDINYFLKYKVSHLYLDTTKYHPDKFQNQRLSIIQGPFEKNKVLFRIDEATLINGAAK
jgi:hypothetical protein